MLAASTSSKKALDNAWHVAASVAVSQLAQIIPNTNFVSDLYKYMTRLELKYDEKQSENNKHTQRFNFEQEKPYRDFLEC